MAPRATNSWAVVRGELPIDEERVAAYRLIVEAQGLIAAARARGGVSHEEIDRALEVCDPPNAEALTAQELYVATLGAFVTALGGHLDGSTAVFADGAIALPPGT